MSGITVHLRKEDDTLGNDAHVGKGKSCAVVVLGEEQVVFYVSDRAGTVAIFNRFEHEAVQGNIPINSMDVDDSSLVHVYPGQPVEIRLKSGCHPGRNEIVLLDIHASI